MVFFGEIERARDLLVGLGLQQALDDLHFAGAELGGAHLLFTPRAIAEATHQLGREVRGHVDLAERTVRIAVTSSVVGRPLSTNP